MAMKESLPRSVLSGAHTRPALARSGVSKRELDGPLWDRTNRGLWFWTGGGAPDASERIRRIRGLLPDGAAIGGWAAAALLGASQFDGEDGAGRPIPVPICLGRHQTCRRREELVVWRSELLPGETVDIDGTPVTSPERTCFDLLRRSAGVQAAVVAADALLRDVSVDRGHVTDLIRQRRRWRGLPTARRAFDLAETRVRSTGESRLRMLWVLDAGLPRPLVNRRLTNPQGYLLGEVDLFDPEAGVAGEYDGEVHAGAARRAADHTREEQLERARVIVVRFTAEDLSRQRLRAVARLRAARATGLRRDRSQDGWILQPLTER